MKKLAAWSVTLASTLLLYKPLLAQTTPPANNARSEIPIREVILTDGERRYGIPIKVGNTNLEAGLDTGSTGLRILPGTLVDGDVQSEGRYDSYSYGAGTQFSGNVGNATLTIGGLSATSTMQVIKTVDCRDDVPNCPASHIPLSKFGVLGSGLPGEGFRGIIGVNMAQSDVASPFSAIGASRWIIELPRPNSGAPGKIVFNPSDDEVKQFVMMPVNSDQKDGLHDSVKGCVVNNVSKDKTCGALLIDTGAPGILINNNKAGSKPWSDGTAATFAFYDSKGLAAIEEFTVGSYSQASHLNFVGGSGAAVTAGLSPYFAFDVLYDPANSAIGLKPRPTAPDAPIGLLVKEDATK